MKKILIFTLLLFLSATMSFAQSIKVSGTVKDSEGNPMPGVYVLDKQSKTKGTATDTDGKYEITVSKNGFLEFSCLGFESKLEQVNGRVKIDVVMKSDAAKLDDVVVIAYGTAKKSDLTGAVIIERYSCSLGQLGPSGACGRYGHDVINGRTRCGSVHPDPWSQVHQCGQCAADCGGRRNRRGF